MDVIGAPSAGLYANSFDAEGEAVEVRRINATGAPVAQVVVRALVRGYQADELVGGISQGDLRILLSAADLAASGFPLPLRQGSVDRILVRGRSLAIKSIDDSTHRFAGELLAYQIVAGG
jgi:hypothetical protein